MAKLRAGVDVIRVMAGRWHAQAAELGTGAPPTSELSSRASAGAVNTGHADITAAATVLTERVQTTAAKVAEADARYTANEAGAAASLAAIGQPVTAP
jgi:hypothetical protein